MNSFLFFYVSFSGIVEIEGRWEKGWRVNGSKWSVKYICKKIKYKGKVREIFFNYRVM